MCSMLVRQRIYPLMSPLSEASDCLPRRLRCRRSFIVAKISDANCEHLIGNAGRIMLIAKGATLVTLTRYCPHLQPTVQVEVTRLEAEPGAAHGL